MQQPDSSGARGATGRDPDAGPVPGTGTDARLGHVLLSSMKDEGPYALEFVAHHRAMGFDRLFIASNDCSDGTDRLLDALDRGGAITHYRNDLSPDDIPQHAAYAGMRQRFGLDRADWLMVLDADEFLSVTVGQGRVQDMTAQTQDDDDIIMLSAKTFGTTPDPDWHPGLVTEQFQRRLALGHRANCPVKTIARGIDRFGAIHNHSVNIYRGTEPLTVLRSDGSRFQIPPGIRLWRYLRNIPRDQIRHGFAHYNHYAIKSMASFALRQERQLGTDPAGKDNDRHTLGYFDNIARARVADGDFVTRHGAALRAEMARLLTLPGVAEAQAEAERRYDARIAALG
ncbi:glycosyltransferase family 2 protein [Paracoccus sphaerophysae]|uniref:glycosyltransferase family 2 protein n=1 Tax=Paracoccus sphaerophysae TaxID=690417 RepID=UPI002354F6D1|nr:glycosyltransferase family 2 protein [Paracoccus sphaerophysae]